jgi:nitroreductase
MNSMLSRRTIRTYSDKTIDDILLNELFEMAFRSSNTGNMQAYSVIVTRDSEMKKKLSSLHFNQPQVLQAPVVITFCADLNRFTKWCEQRNANPGFDNIQAFTYSAIDTVIAAQTLCVAAEERGLGICYLGTTTYNAGKIAKLLQLPELVMPITTISIGFPNEITNEPLPDRLPLPGLIHYEKYCDYDKTDINRIFEYKESRPENKNFVEINGKDNLAQVFTDLRYTKKDNEFFSGEFVNDLRKQGFLK